MEDRLLVEALRSRDPIAMGAVYDRYAESLYDHCWFQLRNVDAAQVAFRDTLMCAEAHAGRLRVPARFGPWLYSLARIECRRRWPAGPVQPDLPVARHDQDDVDLRLMAWRAVAALPALSRELLDLRHRRGLSDADIALTVGLRGRETSELLAQANVLLEAALTAEILAHDGLGACARRATLLRPRRDEIDADLREALVRHSLECASCARHLPDKIAPGKVYALLPRAPLPETLRAQIMNCFTDPELAGYRLFAAARVSRFGAHGFPVQSGTGRTAAFRRAPDDPRAARLWSRAVTAVAGAVIAAVTVSAVCRHLGEEASRDSHGVVAAPPGARSPRPSPAPPGSATRPVPAALPFRPAATARPVVALGDVPPKDFLQAPAAAAAIDVSPDRLVLPPGGAGTVTLSSPDHPVQWRASGAGPLHVSPGEGALRPGTSQAVTVRAPSNARGSAVVTFWPGGEQVEVTWSGHPPYPPPRPPTPRPPAPTPTPTSPPTTTPAPTPTPTMPKPTTPAPPTHTTTTPRASAEVLARRAAAVGAFHGRRPMTAYTVRMSAPRGTLVTPRAVSPGLADLVGRIQRVPWPQWTEPSGRMRREVVELCRLQAARGMTVLSWLAEGGAYGEGASADGDIGWLLTTNRLTGPRQQRMYGAAERLADPVRGLVIANWTWVLSSAHGGRVTAPFFAGRAYPDDGYAAAHATMTLTRLWDRVPDVRQALAAAWAATRTPADWCRAADLQARYGGEVPIFTYPRGPAPPKSAARPWINRLLGCE